MFKSQVPPLVEWCPASLVLTCKLKVHTIHPGPVSQDVFPHQDEDGNVVLVSFVILFLFPLKVLLRKACRMSRKHDLGEMCVTSVLEKGP